MKEMKIAVTILFLCFALSGCKVWYQDADGDGFGNPEISVEAKVQPAGYVMDNTDCDDRNPTIYPGAPEFLDNLDNQCPGDAGYGQIDEGTEEPKIVDFSAFNVFRYIEKESMVGFCPALDTIHTATISKKEDGYHVEMSIIGLRSDAAEGCPDAGQPTMNINQLIAGEDPCFELVQLPPRLLTEAEAQAMEDIFASIMLIYIDYLPENPMVDGICADPCLTVTLSWDRYYVYQQKSACYHRGEYHEKIGGESMRQIMSFLNSLR